MEIRQASGHLDQMIRQTRAHHVTLSTMSDKKANIILTISSLLIPLSIQFLYDPRSHYAAIAMIGFCVLTILLAAYAAMPKLGKKKHEKTNRPPLGHEDNLLFFGAFLKLDLEQYQQEMEALMNDHNRVYEMQIQEIYQMGKYLAQKKYRFVTLAYLAFITGVLISSFIYVLGSF